MSTTGEAGRLSSGAVSSTSVSLDAVIDAPRRLDELSTTRVICEAAEAIHKAQKGGQPVATVSPRMIRVTREGIALDLMAPTSLAYHAPEKVEGKPGDRRTDVFSLGVVLWEALAHERLFDGANDDAIKQAILTKNVPAPSEYNANVPAELDAIVKKALARDPGERFPSTKVMAAELSTILDDAGYPDSHEEIEKYLAAEFPAGVLLASKLAATPAGSGAIKAAGSASIAKAQLNQTVLGMAPIRDPSLDKAAADKLAAEAAAEKAAAEKAAAEKAAADKAAADKLAAEKAAVEKAAAEKAAAEKAAAEKAAAEKAAAEKAAAEKAAAEKAAAEKAAAEKAAAEKAA
nr:protein kinase [Deltaproteobacteria bacterium]